jgi:hypothetical protein
MWNGALLGLAGSICLTGSVSAYPPTGAAPYDTNFTALDGYHSCHFAMQRPPPRREASPNAWQLNGFACAHLAGEALEELDRPTRWCPPQSDHISIENWSPMIDTYFAYYERVLRSSPSVDGHAAFTAALVERWPCHPVR